MYNVRVVTDDRGQMPDTRCQMTDDRRQRTENRRQMSDVRGQITEFGNVLKICQNPHLTVNFNLAHCSIFHI
ncbi:hypothetical protein D1AOALGA4SA_6954 [Olavius algarvensis Delta 1 endosymbiont]|nr:hypothetical protein D1AOALGA4SA_6954 [Olavius algarvensis Delta 1 endosymbiont]